MVEKEVDLTLKSVLASRFGEHRISELILEEGGIPLLMLDLETKSPVTVVMTNGLSEKEMKVPEPVANRKHIELFFCLPSYWEWEDQNNPNTNWVFKWLQRLGEHVLENDTWFGDGHTIYCKEQLSPLMKQDHLFLSDPILLEQEMSPLEFNGKTIHFISIIPIFPDEMDYKQGKGTVKLKQRLINKGVSEKLDDFRTTVLKSKWRIW